MVNNPAGCGSKFRATPPRRNVNSPSSVDSKIEQDQHKLLHGTNMTSAEPVKLSLEYITQCRTSDWCMKRNAEEVRRPREEDLAELKNRCGTQTGYATRVVQKNCRKRSCAAIEWRSLSSKRYCPSYDDANIEEDRSKLLEVVHTPSAQPVGLSVDYIERQKTDHTWMGCLRRSFLGGRYMPAKEGCSKMTRRTHYHNQTIKEIRNNFDDCCMVCLHNPFWL